MEVVSCDFIKLMQQQQNQFISLGMQEARNKSKATSSLVSKHKLNKHKVQSDSVMVALKTTDIRSTTPQQNIQQYPSKQSIGLPLLLSDHHSVNANICDNAQAIVPINHAKSLGNKCQDVNQSNKQGNNFVYKENYQQKQVNHPKGKKNIVSERFKKQLLARDQYEHPLKYKIVTEQLGYNPQKIFKLNNADLTLIQQHYQRSKGLQYLKQSRVTHSSKANKFNIRIKTESPQPQVLNPSRSRQYIHKKFGPLPKQKNINISRSDKNLRKKTSLLKNMQQKQEMLGKVVYNRVRKHLKDQKVSNDFYKRVHSEQAIDEALIEFLKLKIARAQTSLKNV